MAVVQTFSVKGSDYDVHDTKAVYFTNDQTLSEAQKTQAATNIGIKNYDFTILANSSAWTQDVHGYQVQSISANGVKTDYACTPWVCPKFSGNDPSGDATKHEAFGEMGACYIITSPDTITIKITGEIPLVNIPCTLTVWG